MRDQLCTALLTRCDDPKMVFLTGDLGFMALEPLRDRLGPRFINCGVAEQNMVTVAAAMASEGLEVWVYSIAPFCYARPFEQIRNDVCFHGLPVHLLGNGGGYGYGVMGPTHHALEDYGILLSLAGMRAYLPAVDNDVAAVVEAAAIWHGPSYIRLGRDEMPTTHPPLAYAPWRRLRPGCGPVVIAAGTIAGAALEALATIASVTDPAVWVVSELPFAKGAIPDELQIDINHSRRLCVIEEHVAHGGLGALLAQTLVASGVVLDGYRHLFASGYRTDRSGSQKFLRQLSGLGPEAIRTAVTDLAMK